MLPEGPNARVAQPPLDMGSWEVLANHILLEGGGYWNRLTCFAEPLFAMAQSIKTRGTIGGFCSKACKLYLLSEAIGSNELQGLHLAKVRWVAQHVNVHQLGNISVPI